MAVKKTTTIMESKTEIHPPKKTTRPPAKPPAEAVPPSVSALQNDLAQTVAQAQLASGLETDLTKANETIDEQRREITRLKEQIVRQNKVTPFSEDDESRLTKGKFILEFDRNWTTGKPFIRVRGTAPGSKTSFHATTLSDVVQRLRGK